MSRAVLNDPLQTEAGFGEGAVAPLKLAELS